MPPTVMMNKAPATDERHQTLTWGAAQLGVGQGVLDAVADRLLAPDLATVVFVAIWVDPAASDETAVRRAARDAVRAAIAVAVGGPDAAAVERLVRERDTLTNPFYRGRKGAVFQVDRRSGRRTAESVVSLRTPLELGLSESELVITRHALDELKDKLYSLEAAVEDVERNLGPRRRSRTSGKRCSGCWKRPDPSGATPA